MLFILGIRGLTRPDRARQGMQLAAIGMLVAIVGTLLNHEIVTYVWIILGLIVGSIVGAAMSVFMPMTASRNGRLSAMPSALWQRPWSASPNITTMWGISTARRWPRWGSR